MEPFDRPPIDYDRAYFEDGDIAITLSTSRTNMPRTTIAIGRVGKEPGKPNAWIPFEWIDDVMAALLALKHSEHADTAARAAAVREVNSNSSRGNQFQDVWTEHKRSMR